MTTEKGMVDIGKTLQDAFDKWLEERYGRNTAQSIRMQYRQTPLPQNQYYQFWYKSVYPYSEEYKTLMTPTTPVATEKPVTTPTYQQYERTITTSKGITRQTTDEEEVYYRRIIELFSAWSDSGIMDADRATQLAQESWNYVKDYGITPSVPYQKFLMLDKPDEGFYLSLQHFYEPTPEQAQASFEEKRAKAQAEMEREARVTGAGISGRGLDPEVLRTRAFQTSRPEYELPIAEEEIGGFNVPQTESWQYWFRNKYSSKIREFESGLPEWSAGSYRGLSPEQASRQIEKSWADWFKKEKPKILEERASLSPYERG